MKVSLRAGITHLQAWRREQWVLLLLAIAFAVFMIVLFTEQTRVPIGGR